MFNDPYEFDFDVELGLSAEQVQEIWGADYDDPDAVQAYLVQMIRNRLQRCGVFCLSERNDVSLM